MFKFDIDIKIEENKHNIGSWFIHPEHPRMLVYRTGINSGFGWDCKGHFNVDTWWNFKRMEVAPNQKELIDNAQGWLENIKVIHINRYYGN